MLKILFSIGLCALTLSVSAQVRNIDRPLQSGTGPTNILTMDDGTLAMLTGAPDAQTVKVFEAQRFPGSGEFTARRTMLTVTALSDSGTSHPWAQLLWRKRHMFALEQRFFVAAGVATLHNPQPMGVPSSLDLAIFSSTERATQTEEGLEVCTTVDPTTFCALLDNVKGDMNPAGRVQVPFNDQAFAASSGRQPVVWGYVVKPSHGQKGTSDRYVRRFKAEKLVVVALPDARGAQGRAGMLLYELPLDSSH